MSLRHDRSKRRILPRWRASGKASHSADFLALRSATKQPTFAGNALPAAVRDFKANQTIGTAAEFLSSSLLVGEKEAAFEAAHFILARENDAPNTLVSLARSVVVDSDGMAPDINTENEQVRQTKRLLRLQSDNPMLWSDMARHFASHGDHQRAKRCMQAALQLAPNHRWMLRTASRFLVHQNDPVAAHKLLANHPRTRHDPWLIAAELACAQVAGRPPKHWRQANDMLRMSSVAPFHLSELATAVAMMELEGGERKRARRYIKKGLEAPTENTLAQVFWAKENKHLGNGYELDQLVRTAEYAYEADYRLSLLQGDLPLALKAAKTWATDEPFAARPRAEIVFVASLLDNHDLALEVAHAVRRLQGQRDSTLEMNAIFSTLSSGRLAIETDFQELERVRNQLFKAIEQGSDDAYHALANMGLWQYRYGHQGLGRELYQMAIETAERRHMLDAAAMAAIFAAREAILARHPVSAAVLRQAKDLTKRSKNMAGEFYLRKLDALSQCPENADEILSPASANRFLKTSKPDPGFRIEKRGKEVVLIVQKRNSSRLSES